MLISIQIGCLCKSVDSNALCKIYKNEFSLSNMRVQAVKSHSKSKKKKKTLLCSIVSKSSAPMNTFFTRQSNINSCAVSIQNHLQDMFPDSIFAKKFGVGKDKEGYMTTFGIAEHF